ncbi:MAG: hypothetical protein ACRDMJ_06180, partial [Solirubrobacteraceae bacterium]
YCESLASQQGYTSDVCSEPNCPSSGCAELPQTASTASISAGSAGAEALCPGVNSVQQAVIFVCIPSLVQGDVDTGSKPLVLLPGGILILLPVGQSGWLSLSTTPNIQSDSAIISMGGVIAGYNVALKAPSLALAAGVVQMANNVSLQGNQIDVGTVDLTSLVGSVPNFGGELGGAINAISTAVSVAQELHITSIPPTTGLFSAPLDVGASSILASPGASLDLASDASFDTEGRGNPGGPPGGALAPGGAGNYRGGTHAGYGGSGESLFSTGDGYGVWQSQDGRGPAYDDPFAPSQPGNGGSGFVDDSVGRGAPGGGVVTIQAGQATVTIDGSLDADGSGTGYDTSSGSQYPGDAGQGAGGSIDLTAATLAGSGQITADGGGICATCENAFGGGGGGGMVALVYGDGSGWSGVTHARGGADLLYPGRVTDSDEYYGTGGAGTLFTRQVTLDGSGNVTGGVGSFPDGTLTIDGGEPAGYYPPPDGTPIPDSWDSQQRRLVLTGEARAYAHAPSFGEIDVSNGSDLTSEPSVQQLSVTAATLKVDGTSRIDMTARGYAGGTNGYDYYNDPTGGAGGTAPGQTPSVREYGGSHGGAGGAPTGYLHPELGDAPGSTYDDPANPSLPGGGGAGGGDTQVGNPGGGVLDVTAGMLVDDGTISANGQDSNGPTATDPTPFLHPGGAGAGGSVLVHATTLGGSGAVRADGGWTCLTDPGRRLLAGGHACSTPEAGGGGGGLVAVYATSCDWTGSLSAAGGIDEAALGTDVAQTTGQSGSAQLFSTSGSCPGAGASGSPPAQGPSAPSGPTSTPTPPTGAASVGRISSKGSKLFVPVHCVGSTPCAITVAATIHKRVKVHVRRHGRRVTITRTQTVTVGRAGATIAAGKTSSVAVALNSTGAALLARHGSLPVTVTVTQRRGRAAHRLTSRRVKLHAARHRRPRRRRRRHAHALSRAQYAVVRERGRGRAL